MIVLLSALAVAETTDLTGYWESESGLKVLVPLMRDGKMPIIFMNGKPIAMVGVRDCVIVQTDDTTLVAHKKATAKMRELVAKLAADKAYRNLT